VNGHFLRYVAEKAQVTVGDVERAIARWEDREGWRGRVWEVVDQLKKKRDTPLGDEAKRVEKMERYAALARKYDAEDAEMAAKGKQPKRRPMGGRGFG
jgi:hypothetical protein